MPLESIHEQNSNSSESESPQNLEGEANLLNVCSVYTCVVVK